MSAALRTIDVVHRWAGGTIGLLLALLGSTGTILLYRRSWIMLPHTGDPQRQATAELAGVTERLMTDPRARPRMIVFADRDFGLDRLNFNGTAGAYTDQAGHEVARWASQWERPELWLLDLHRHLFAGQTGATIVGVAGLAGIGFVVTGGILWWRTKRTFAFRLWPRRMSRPAIVRHHRDLGIVAAPLLLLSLTTGVLLIFRPLTALPLGAGAPAAIARAFAPPPAPPAMVGKRIDWRDMIVKARERFPDAELRSLALPQPGQPGLITIRMRQPGEWLPGGRSIIWFAADTGKFAAARDARETVNAVAGFDRIFPLHAAEIDNPLYKALLTGSGLALVVLGTLSVWTFWCGKGGRPRS